MTDALNIWLVKDLEPLPTDPGNRRLMRAGMLAQTLARLGHRVHWFTSSFDHYRKQQRASGLLHPEPNLAIHVLPGLGYKRNIGLRRIRHNRRFAKSFAQFAEQSPYRPDIVVTDIPTTESARTVVDFGRAHNIPTVLSIRDLWPDFFANFIPAPIRPIARLALLPLENEVRFACRYATSLIGISERYLEWGQAKGERLTSEHDKVFPLGYEPEPELSAAESQSLLRELGVRPGGWVIAFVGSWGETYDLELVVQLASRLVDRSNIQFVIAGDGEDRAGLAARLKSLPNVVLTGWIDRSQIAALLRRADVGLLPYRAGAPQGLPNKLFEYMAYGTYGVATLGGELSTFYARVGAGIALPGSSPTQLAMEIERILACPEVHAGRRQRVASFEQEFTSQRIYARMSNHLVEVAEVSRRNASGASH